MNVLRTTTDADQILTVWLDQPEKPVNTVPPQTLAELTEVVGAIEKDQPRGVIFASAKGHSFVAGADLFAIRKMSQEQVTAFLADGQALSSGSRACRCRRWPRSMETASAAASSWRLGVQVARGGGRSFYLHRAAGGESRHPAGMGRHGPPAPLDRVACGALPMILAGKTLPPKKALRAGVVDEVVRPEALARRRETARPPRRRRTEDSAGTSGCRRPRPHSAACVCRGPQSGAGTGPRALPGPDEDRRGD